MKGSWHLLHARLAINDLSPAGDQPITNEDGSLVMIFNGEIYNSPDLRTYCEKKGHTFRSTMDGEVILHLWEMEGVAALARLNGIFSVAIASTETGEVFLARDPLGVKPLFYVAEHDSLWFASDLATLAALGAPLGGDDLVALAQFLTFLWIPDPRTPHERARSLVPGCVLHWNAEGVRVEPYGPELVPPEEPCDLSEGQAIDDFRDRFSESVQRQLLSDVPIGLMASGGIDSSLLWWSARDSLSRAYTITWEGQGRERLDEDASAVAQLERRFGTHVNYLSGESSEVNLLPASGDLLADPAFGLVRTIAARAREDGLKVLFCGHGGDEILGGYRRHAVASLLGRRPMRGLASLAKSTLARARSDGVGAEYRYRLAAALAERDPFRGYMRLATYSTPGDRAKALDCTTAEVTDDVVWARHREVFEALPPGLSFLRKAMTLDLRVYLPGLGLSYVDRGGMEFGVEIRVPWLDLDLVRWSLAIPERFLIQRRQGKWLGRTLAESVLSSEVANRPKRGFGAPHTRVAHGQSASGELGFRQSQYLANAVSLLDRRRAVASP